MLPCERNEFQEFRENIFSIASKIPESMSLSPSSTGNLIFGLLISGISSCLTSLNFFITILNLRSYYLTLKTMPLFPWALLITGGMLLLTLPILSGALLMVLADLHSNRLSFVFGRRNRL